MILLFGLGRAAGERVYALGLMRGRFVVVMLMLSSITAAASAQTRTIVVRNETDRWARMTAIGVTWCVKPHSVMTKEKFSANVRSVRVELTAGQNCADPRIYDATPNNVPLSSELEFLISQQRCGKSRETCYSTRAYPLDHKHDDAQRLARIIVSEIKLHNEEQVELGRKNKDLYLRLREQIDHGRQEYEVRTPPDVLRSTDYFYDALVRILAAGDPTALGM